MEAQTAQQPAENDPEKLKAITQAVKDGLNLFLAQNHQSLMKLLFTQFENHKIDYAHFGQEALLEILSKGHEICCQGTLLQTSNKRLVLRSFLRLEDSPVNQQASTPVNQ